MQAVFLPPGATPLVIVAVVLTAAVTFILTRSLDSRRRGSDATRISTLEGRLAELSAERDGERRRAEELSVKAAQAESKSVADGERLSWLTEADRTLRETFEALASRTLRQTTHVLTEQNREQLQNLLTPLNSELQKLDRHVRTMEEKREGAYQGVVEQVRMISEQYRNLQTATTSLDQALRAPNVRGRWGEVQLRRLVEMAGMVEHVDFEEQKSAAGTGAAGRPDMVIHLPSDAIVPVDAKAPMSAYLDSQEAQTPELAKEAARRHARALRGHVQALSQKAYWSQFPRAPEFVVMLVPYESGLASAFTNDPELLEYALANRVIVAAPASFLALLRVVAYGWMQIELSRNADAIAETGKELLNRLVPFSDHLNRLGASLGQAVDRFNDAAGSYEHRVLPGVRRLQELGASSSVPQSVESRDATVRKVRGKD
ncbi:MAG: DNA recombination protein RmuC [Alkalispirochaeta sp.]